MQTVVDEALIIAQIAASFPKIAGTDWYITSRPDTLYNCIAWAADDPYQWWWPAGPYFWPDGVERERTLVAYMNAFETLGYTKCDEDKIDVQSVERVALFTKDGNPTHACRQLESGRWTSKMGAGVDIDHPTPEALEGDIYGKVTLLMCRDRPT